jgi:hypothetical protein
MFEDDEVNCRLDYLYYTPDPMTDADADADADGR